MAGIHALQSPQPLGADAEEGNAAPRWLERSALLGSATNWYRRVEERLVEWMAAHGISLLRISLGIVLLWFGALKFVPGGSPAERLATATIGKLTFGLLEAPAALLLLAVWETVVGIALVIGTYLRVAIALLLLQMAGTLTPLALFPALTFASFPFAPTMEGQYILKNLVLISAALVVGATTRGGKLNANPFRCERCTGRGRSR